MPRDIEGRPRVVRSGTGFRSTIRVQRVPTTWGEVTRLNRVGGRAPTPDSPGPRTDPADPGPSGLGFRHRAGASQNPARPAPREPSRGTAAGAETGRERARACATPRRPSRGSGDAAHSRGPQIRRKAVPLTPPTPEEKLLGRPSVSMMIPLANTAGHPYFPPVHVAGVTEAPVWAGGQSARGNPPWRPGYSGSSLSPGARPTPRLRASTGAVQ